jgi:hypothetical protein
VLAAACVYLPSLTGGFTFDDRAAVLTNANVTNPRRPWARLLRDDFWGSSALLSTSNKSWRPLTVAAFRAVRVLAQPGGGNPPAWPYRLLNLLLNCAVTAQVHALALLLGGVEGHAQAQGFATLAGATAPPRAFPRRLSPHLAQR